MKRTHAYTGPAWKKIRSSSSMADLSKAGDSGGSGSGGEDDAAAARSVRLRAMSAAATAAVALRRPPRRTAGR